MTGKQKKWVRNPETRILLDIATRQGWTIDVAHGGHVKLRSPSGDLVVTSASGSDRRAHLNLRALLRQKGLDV